ncbi:hypothetical protein [Sulfolobus acidocaldarius]|uniref:Uncharacterized protein n=3 Tax=Sulfolobus acidocaldarius TaxID=2285 RepID=Q4JA90_SULAC|nr:hypothetical protein [Sulfolobus acidocaldarius]AAY80290.1 hypothetical protein Saci_0927 [Sulfolobus acidocaldarius DSM 639]AGE70870.1 hypothetical protein SacN8_04495 [Sulfolobus acidocaldarius N8]AGE73141.1 hypothetical protein SacRon12I_04485 [Sulfolobus acidocaldarius Ron12/I]
MILDLIVYAATASANGNPESYSSLVSMLVYVGIGLSAIGAVLALIFRLRKT